VGLISNVIFNGFYYHHSFDEHPNTKEFYMHCHNFYEIYYFVQGGGSFIIEGNCYELKKNTLLLMRPSEFHYFKIEKPIDYERCVLHFDINELMECFSNNLLLSPFQNRELGKNNLLLPYSEDEIEKLFHKLDKCSILPPEEQTLKAQFILGELLCLILNISKRDEFDTAFNSSNALVEAIIQYINKHINSPIVLDELSSKFFVSKYYLSHMFKKYTGVSVLEYALRKKVLLASQMIKNGEKAIVAAKNLGFGDYSSFYRAYKKFLGESPKNK
jgi:AraC-like DNA-binding protein